MQRYLLLVVGTILGLVADQAPKIWAVAALSMRPEGALPEDAAHIVTRTHVVFEWLNMRLAGNKGAAWGLFRSLPEAYRIPFFVAIGVVAVVIIVSLYRKADHQPLLRWALTFVLGGAIGNLIDRVRYGFVVDFIDAHWASAHWPTFNVADIGITVGVGLLIIDMLLQGRKAADAAEDPARAAD